MSTLGRWLFTDKQDGQGSTGPVLMAGYGHVAKPKQSACGSEFDTFVMYLLHIV